MGNQALAVASPRPRSDDSNVTTGVFQVMKGGKTASLRHPAPVRRDTVVTATPGASREEYAVTAEILKHDPEEAIRRMLAQNELDRTAAQTHRERQREQVVTLKKIADRHGSQIADLRTAVDANKQTAHADSLYIIGKLKETILAHNDLAAAVTDMDQRLRDVQIRSLTMPPQITFSQPAVQIAPNPQASANGRFAKTLLIVASLGILLGIGLIFMSRFAGN